MDWLVFIDTNILLDFYRIEGKQQQGLSVLRHLEGNYDRFITSMQVEMEFKKNRQRIIADAFQPLTKLVPQTQQALPAFLKDLRPAQSLLKAEGKVRECVERLRVTTRRIIEEPTKHDEVYKLAQRLFSTDTPHNLNRKKDVRHEIRELAKKRFRLGFPPRKNSDTSYGDAINWEWIVRCARDSKCNVVIVSRDSDYGQLVGKDRILNTWLRQEFFSQTSKRHEIFLTELLTQGLKRAGITVSAAEQKEESAFLQERQPSQVNRSLLSLLPPLAQVGAMPSQLGELQDLLERYARRKLDP